jgi:hypothetical protein
MRNKPFHEIRDGLIKATIWKNTRQKNERPIIIYSVDVTRSYKDNGGNWKESTSFSGNELLRVANLYERAYNAILNARKLENTSEDPQEEPEAA